MAAEAMTGLERALEVFNEARQPGGPLAVEQGCEQALFVKIVRRYLH